MNIDYNFLRAQIRQIAQEDIKVISSSSLKLYASDVREFFKKYISAQVKEIYKKLVETIPDEKQLEFINLETGYVISMTKWINANPMLLPTIDIEEDEEEKGSYASSNIDLRELVRRKEVQIVGVGTAISFLLVVSGLKIWALLAESLAIACGIYEYNAQREMTREVNFRKEQELQSKVNNFISIVESNAMEWVKSADEQSDIILSKFK